MFVHRFTYSFMTCEAPFHQPRTDLTLGSSAILSKALICYIFASPLRFYDKSINFLRFYSLSLWSRLKPLLHLGPDTDVFCDAQQLQGRLLASVHLETFRLPGEDQMTSCLPYWERHALLRVSPKIRNSSE